MKRTGALREEREANLPTTAVLCGHRVLLAGPKRITAVRRPPVVLIGGTAQNLDSWGGHLSFLCRERRVMILEARGQAGRYREEAGLPQLDLGDCSLAAHATDFWRVVASAGEQGLIEPRPGEQPGAAIDVIGFSFGARVAMAAAAGAREHGPTSAWTIRRLCTTAVTADRGSSGRELLESWRSLLAASDLRGFALKLLLDTHSPGFIARNEKRVAGWVDAVLKANDVRGLRAIVEQTHTEDEADTSHPVSLAMTIARDRSVERGLLLVGEDDALSPMASSRHLAMLAGWSFSSVAESAHACPIEQPVHWRRAVLDFLDND